MSKGYSVTINRTTYQDFPTVDELLPLSNNLIHSYLDFLKDLGISHEPDIFYVFGSPQGAEQILTKCHVRLNEYGETTGWRHEEYTRWQRKILKDDCRAHQVSVSQILARVIDRNKFFKRDAVRHEVELALIRARKSCSIAL